MSFLLPLALLGLLTLPVILLLHLLRNRREQLIISSLPLWLGLQQKRHGALPRYIPLSLMLLLQLLVATGLTLALARPALSFLLDRPQQTIFILDMTTSMMAEDVSLASNPTEGKRRFDVARQIIQTHLQAMADKDTLAVISLDPRPQILLTAGGQQKMQALLTLDNLVPGATGLDLPAALTLANGLIDQGDRRRQIIILTDGTYPVERDALPAMLAPVTWQIISARPEPGGRVPNQALLNVSARTLPDGRHRLFARLINYDHAPVNRTLRVSVDERTFDEMTIQLEPQQEAAYVWTLPASAETTTVEIVEPDVLPLDQRAELLLTGMSHYRVLLVSDTPDILARALAVQPGVDLTVDSLAMAGHDPVGFDLVVFEGIPPELTAWPGGNLLIVNPPLGHPLLPAQNFARNLRPDLGTVSPLLAGIDLSGVYFSRVPQLILPDWAEADLWAISPATDQPANTTPPLIFHGSVENSRLVVWAFDLAESNLPARLALPLLTANTLSTLLSPSPPPVVSVGEPVWLGGRFSVQLPDGRRLFLSTAALKSPALKRQTGEVFSRTKQPGIYRIYNDNDTLVAGFAVQAGSALESNLATQVQPDILDMTGWPEGDNRHEAETANPQIAYHEFWPWLAGLAMIVVMVEGWLAWRR